MPPILLPGPVSRVVFARRSLLLAALGACSSSSPPPKPPPPPILPAPAEVSWLSVHVHQLVQPCETSEDEDEYRHLPGYTSMLRSAFGVALQRAGYTVVVHRKSPRDLVAKIHATWPSDSPGVASLALLDGASLRPIVQLSALTPISREGGFTQYLEEHAAADLANAMSRSAALASFASKRKAARSPEIAE